MTRIKTCFKAIAVQTRWGRSFAIVVSVAIAISGSCGHAQETANPSETAHTTPAPTDFTHKSLQTFYLTNLTNSVDANDLLNELRNMVPNAKIYYVKSQNAITVLGDQAEIELAQKIIAALDRTKKLYRVTYTVTDTDSGKLIGVQRYSLVIASGSKTDLKQGSRVPVITGAYNEGAPASNSQVQYLDVGLNIMAALDAYVDGARLLTEIEQSSVAEEHSGVGPQDPVIRQTKLEGTATLIPGKPLVLGSLDIPGSTRHQEIEVTSELVR